MFTPIRTRRLLIRPFLPDDLEAYHARRADPDVARYQDWELPYPMERAEKVVSAMVAMDGPENDKWWMAIVCDPDTGEVFGDLARSSHGRVVPPRWVTPSPRSIGERGMRPRPWRRWSSICSRS